MFAKNQVETERGPELSQVARTLPFDLVFGLRAMHVAGSPIAGALARNISEYLRNSEIFRDRCTLWGMGVRVCLWVAAKREVAYDPAFRFFATGR